VGYHTWSCQQEVSYIQTGNILNLIRTSPPGSCRKIRRLTEPRNEPGEPNYAPEGALEDDIVKIIPVEGTEPGGLSWADSYSVGDRCYMWTNLDHDIAMVEVYTPIGKMTVETLYETLDPGPGHTGHPLYNDIQVWTRPWIPRLVSVRFTHETTAAEAYKADAT